MRHGHVESVKDVLEAVKAGRSPLVLTERNEHLD